jgi:hypothetical protein
MVLQEVADSLISLPNSFANCKRNWAYGGPENLLPGMNPKGAEPLEIA